MAKNVRIYNRRLINDIEAFRFYRQKSKLRNFDNTHRWEEHRKLINKFWDKVGTYMVENPNGVFIRNLGYFTILMNPKKQITEWKNKEMIINSHTDGRKFYPIFLPITKQSMMNVFILDHSFVKPLRHKLSKELKKGKKYYNHFGVLYSLYKNKR